MHINLRNPITMLWLGALLGCAEPTTASDSVAVDGEQLLASAPEGWQQGFATNRQALRIVEYIPGDASSEDWVEKISFESLSGDPLPDPIDFVTGIGADQSATCERFEHFNIQSGLENNYPTSVRLLTCSRNTMTEKGQVTLIKAIQGNDNFYVITRAKTVPPVAEGAPPVSEEVMARWAAYMRAITVCDSNREEHPCTAIPGSQQERPAS